MRCAYNVQVQAHGGQLLQRGGIFYWVGEGLKGDCDRVQSPGGCRDDISQQFNLYSSPDLANWTFVSAVLDQVSCTRSCTLGEYAGYAIMCPVVLRLLRVAVYVLQPGIQGMPCGGPNNAGSPCRIERPKVRGKR